MPMSHSRSLLEAPRCKGDGDQSVDWHEKAETPLAGRESKSLLSPSGIDLVNSLMYIGSMPSLSSKSGLRHC